MLHGVKFYWIILVALFVVSGCDTQPPREEPTSGILKAAEINAKLGIAYLKEGKVEVAKKKFAKAYRQNPDSVSVNTGMGVLFERLDDIEKAEEHYKRAVDLEGEQNASNAHNNYASFLCGKKRYKEADRLFMLAAENRMYANREISLTNSGLCAFQQGDKDKAESRFRYALSVNKNYAPALQQMCMISFNKKVYKLAKRYLDRCMGTGMKNLEIVYLGYMIESKLGNDFEKRKYAGMLKSLYPDSKEAFKVYQDEE
ncbi:MAG: type IV pilus biogenesis/stability protein PilW [Gammaproteobacteria bacterium]|nr:MAG: type IV pilus biogenesis/stability protein PilW [Gammaproteobacteria bacterium]